MIASVRLVRLYLTTDEHNPDHVGIDDRTWSAHAPDGAYKEAVRLTQGRAYNRGVVVHGAGYGTPTEGGPTRFVVKTWDRIGPACSLKTSDPAVMADRVRECISDGHAVTINGKTAGWSHDLGVHW